MKRTLAILLILAQLLIAIAPVALAATPTTPTTPSGLPLSEIDTAIEKLVTEYMAEFTPGTAVAVVHYGEVIFSRGFGYADPVRGIRATADITVFERLIFQTCKQSPKWE